MKGIYVILVNVLNDSKIKIGSLGKLLFEKGKYAYVGSALNGLEKRIARHLRTDKKMHWHIDYLLASKNAEIDKAFVKGTSEREECKIAREIACNGEAVKGFGCSDCKCESHLFKVNGFSPAGMEEFK